MPEVTLTSGTGTVSSLRDRHLVTRLLRVDDSLRFAHIQSRHSLDTYGRLAVGTESSSRLLRVAP